MTRDCDNCLHEMNSYKEPPCDDCTAGNNRWHPKASTPCADCQYQYTLTCGECVNYSEFVRDVKDEPVIDNVNAPQHYMHGGIETIDVIRCLLTPEEFRGYCKGNLLKYRERAPYKGKTDEDYAKAKKYYEWLLETNA